MGKCLDNLLRNVDDIVGFHHKAGVFGGGSGLALDRALDVQRENLERAIGQRAGDADFLAPGGVAESPGLENQFPDREFCGARIRPPLH